MKLIHDCIRDVMLYIEDNLQDNNVLMTSEISYNVRKYTPEDINYTCKKLYEAGYLNIECYVSGEIAIKSMTYNGHLFLDNVRDNKIWSATKSIISKFASVSLPIIQQVAVQLINNQLGIK